MSPKPIPKQQLTADRLANAIQQAIADEPMGQRKEIVKNTHNICRIIASFGNTAMPIISALISVKIN